MKDLANKINNFDFYYMMSDSNKVYRAGSLGENKINETLKSLEPYELKELSSLLTDFALDYFNIEVVEEPKDEGPKKVSTMSVIMSNAWSLVKRGVYNNISGALAAAWKRYKLVNRLKNGVAHFTYTKANGDTRQAIGTLREGNYRYQKNSAATGPVEVVKYFDLVKRQFRSCRIDRLVQL